MVDDKQIRKSLELYGNAIRQPEGKKKDKHDKDPICNIKETRYLTESENLDFIVARKNAC